MTQVDSKIPPGIDGARNPEYYASGGDENAWLSFSKKKYYTNAFIVEDGKVKELLSLSLTPFGLKETFVCLFFFKKVAFRIEEARLWKAQVSSSFTIPRLILITIN